MKQYPQIISRLFNVPLLITQSKHRAICQVLDARLSGVAMDPAGAAVVEEDGYGAFGTDAVIPVHGVIGKHLSGLDMISGGCDIDTVSSMIDVALADENVETLIFDFRSPGGEVTGIAELGRKIAAITSKKTVAFTDSECCSAALWLATQCQSFYCTGSASVGSIGVWCAYMDSSKAMDRAGENMQSVSAGKYKLLGAYWKPLSSEELSMVQKHVDKIYAQFKEAVNLRREVADEFMQGQVFDGEEAVAAGLADGLVESLDELIAD